MKTKRTTSDTFAKKAASAVNMFKTAIDNLRSTNNEIDAEVSVNKETIKSIEAENKSLHNIKTQNERILGNLEGLFK